jgi:hypothetical protein
MDEYKGVVDETLGEIQDLKDAIEFDEDEMSAAARNRRYQQGLFQAAA